MQATRTPRKPSLHPHRRHGLRPLRQGSQPGTRPGARARDPRRVPGGATVEVTDGPTVEQALTAIREAGYQAT